MKKLIAVGVAAAAAVAYRRRRRKRRVYVEEVGSGARPIGGVGTSTAAFVGSDPEKPKTRGRPAGR